MSGRYVVAALACCVSLLWSPAVSGQDLGRPVRPIEGGPVDVAQLTQRADLVVHGIVTDRRAAWIGRVIYTLYDVAVQETLKGAPRNGVVIAVPGGALGNVALTIPGAPTVAIGEQLVVFGTPVEGGPTFTPVGTFDGLVRVRQGSGQAGATVAPRGRPEALDAFLEEVRTLGRRP